jgi:hypothetical protein
MAHNTTLKFKRKKSPPLPELVDKLIKKSAGMLKAGELKASVSDLVRAVHLRRKLFPLKPAKRSPAWVDRWSQLS